MITIIDVLISKLLRESNPVNKKAKQVTTDRYKRMIGKVYLGDRYINAEMVANGAAWVYRKYNKDPHMLYWNARRRSRAGDYGRCRRIRRLRLGSGGSKEKIYA